MKALSYGLIYNPTSGRGKAKTYAEEIRDYFLANGDALKIIESSKDGIQEDFLKDLSGLIVVGGDGTIRPYLPSLANLKIPVILFPAGNESLIAQQFKVTHDISELYNRVKASNISSHYFGLANGEPFFLMCSVGFDADVVHWVGKHRVKFSSDILYVRGMLATILNRAKKYKIKFLDIEFLLEGSVIIANSPFYGGGVRPVAEADSSFKSLQVRCFKGSYLRMVFNFLIMKLGVGRYIIEKAQEVTNLELRAEDHSAGINYQIDGDARVGEEELKIEISVETIKFY